MSTRISGRGCSVLVSLTLMTSILAVTAVAQAPDDPSGLPPRGVGGAETDAINRGGFSGPRPFTTGTVTGVNVNTGTITITPQSGNSDSNSQVIKVDPDAQFITQDEVALADLKVGDQIQVQGVPTGINVSQFTIGQAPVGLPGMGGFGPGGFGGPHGAGTADGSRAGGASGPAAAPSFAAASGTIKAMPTKADPHLAISLSADIQLFLKIADGARITRYRSLKITAIKPGDRIVATGQTAADGTLTADTVGVNMSIPGGPGRSGHLSQ